MSLSDRIRCTDDAAEDASALDYAFEAWARENPLWRTTCCAGDLWDFDPTGEICPACLTTITPEQVTPIPRSIDAFYDEMGD